MIKFLNKKTHNFFFCYATDQESTNEFEEKNYATEIRTEVQKHVFRTRMNSCTFIVYINSTDHRSFPRIKENQVLKAERQENKSKDNCSKKAHTWTNMWDSIQV